MIRIFLKGNMMTHHSKRLWLVILMGMLSFVHASSPQHSPQPFANLPKPDKALIRDLILLNYPPFDWRQEKHKYDENSLYDVVIIGGGMAGLTAGAALFKEGIFHIKIFDQNVQGLEGPWITYARMKTLRSNKDIMGPALGIPHLTFRAWFEASFGIEAWKQVKKIPNELWMDYLKWYRQVLKLPVENQWTLVDLIPLEHGFELTFLQAGCSLKVKARKVILATGRAGFGGPSFPHFVQDLPRKTYAHTMDPIDFETLKERRIGIVGVGASAFDAAAVALETGAKSVDLIMRRNRLPSINKFNSLPYKGFCHGYFKLSDEKRWEFMCEAFSASIPPPVESLKRVEGYPNFRILANMVISKVSFDGNQILIETNRGIQAYDFLIVATGFQMNGYQQPELRHVIHQIALWKDRLPAEVIHQNSSMGDFPYLGSSYEFLPKKPGTAPYLKNLYCYNYGATLSHGLLSSDIPAISIGATRLAQGIAADFFMEDCDKYLEDLKNYQVQDFEQEDFSLNIQY